MNNELTHCWVECSLGDVVEIKNGYAFPSKEFRTSGIPLIRQGNLASHNVSLEKCVYLDPTWISKKPDFIIRKSDMLIGMSGSVGKLCVYDLGTPALQNQRIGKLVLRFPELVSWQYIWEYLKTVESQLLKKGKGLGVLNVSADDIESLAFRMPPINEQHRIVAKLEKLLAKVEACQERLNKIPTLLKRFRQSVLAAACSGRLTTDWREQNSNIEPAERLGNGDPPSDFDLPLTWNWLFSAHAFGFVTSGSRGWARFYSAEGALFIRVGNLNHDDIKLDLKSIQRVSPPVSAEGRRTKVIEGDILISITADVGMVALVEAGLEEAYINQHVALGRPVGNMDRKYLAYFLTAKNGGQAQFLNLQRGATKVGLGLDDIRRIWIACPPLAEQVEIVSRVEALFKIADQIEERYKKAKAYIDKLTQAILAKAFRGELVPQDPNDEPALELLKRLTTRDNSERKNKDLGISKRNFKKRERLHVRDK